MISEEGERRNEIFSVRPTEWFVFRRLFVKITLFPVLFLIPRFR